MNNTELFLFKVKSCISDCQDADHKKMHQVYVLPLIQRTKSMKYLETFHLSKMSN